MTSKDARDPALEDQEYLDWLYEREKDVAWEEAFNKVRKTLSESIRGHPLAAPGQQSERNSESYRPINYHADD
jgi:hypothetical protein